MPWDGCSCGSPISPGTGPSDCAAGRRPGGRGVDLPARVEPGRRPALRLRPDRLVEPVSGRDGDVRAAASGGRRVRLAPVGLRRCALRLPRATAGSRASGTRRRAAPRDAGSRLRRAARSRRPVFRDGARRSTSEGDRVAFVGGGPSIPDEVVLLDVTARRSTSFDRRRRLDVDEAASRSRARSSSRPRAAHRVRALLSAGEPRRAATGRRAAAAHRDEPRRADRRAMPSSPWRSSSGRVEGSRSSM